MRKLLLTLLFLTVVVSLWGLWAEKAMAGSRMPDETAQTQDQTQGPVPGARQPKAPLGIQAPAPGTQSDEDTPRYEPPVVEDYSSSPSSDD